MLESPAPRIKPVVISGIRGGNEHLNFLSTGHALPSSSVSGSPASFCNFQGSGQGPPPPQKHHWYLLPVHLSPTCDRFQNALPTHYTLNALWPRQFPKHTVQPGEFSLNFSLMKSPTSPLRLCSYITFSGMYFLPFPRRTNWTLSVPSMFGAHLD